jgi:hypothetical protein
MLDIRRSMFADIHTVYRYGHRQISLSVHLNLELEVLAAVKCSRSQFSGVVRRTLSLWEKGSGGRLLAIPDNLMAVVLIIILESCRSTIIQSAYISGSMYVDRLELPHERSTDCDTGFGSRSLSNAESVTYLVPNKLEQIWSRMPRHGRYSSTHSFIQYHGIDKRISSDKDLIYRLKLLMVGRARGG